MTVNLIQSTNVTVEASGDAPARHAVLVCEGWWHPNCKKGQVHDHPESPNGAWSMTMHRQCEPVFTMRESESFQPVSGSVTLRAKR